MIDFVRALGIVAVVLVAGYLLNHEILAVESAVRGWGS